MDEILFSVDGATAVRAVPVSLAEAGFRERADLQEWVLAHPDILGTGVLPIAFEFDSWRNAAGERERDRLDVLGLGEDGRLVIVELKRDRAPETVEMQAIKYAALASRFTADLVLDRYVDFLASRGEVVSEEQALARLESHAGALDPDALRQPRIVLVAGSFPPVVTASVVWLNEMGIDIALQRVQAYRIRNGSSEGIVVSVSRIFPLPDVEDFTVVPIGARARAAERRTSRAQHQGPIRRLVQSGLIEDGTILRMLVPTGTYASSVRDRVEAWLDGDPKRGEASWRNVRPEALVWAVDGNTYRVNDLVRHIVHEAGGEVATTQGIRWWVLPDGEDLATKAAGVAGGFIWTVLHDLLAALPAGNWASYGDIAQVVGTAAQPLGNHVTRCAECTNPWRVLTANGNVATNFSWGNADDERDPLTMLEAEGITFENGTADPNKRLSVEELRLLVEE